MKEIRTILGPSPDPGTDGSFPGAVYEWCINSAVVDYNTKAALINSEDGHLYRWDLTSGSITQGVLLDGPRGQAYTPSDLAATLTMSPVTGPRSAVASP